MDQRRRQKKGTRRHRVPARIAIVVSRFNERVTSKLLQGAREYLTEHGVRDFKVFFCPGAFELPQVAGKLVRQNTWDAVVCLGAVIRGETSHFEYVASEAARGLQEVALRSGVPVAFGVLTTENERQALERAGGKLGNKGWEAAAVALEMASLFRNLENLK